MARARLTKRIIDAARADDGRDLMLWDLGLPGFGVRVKPTGAKSFVVQYRTDGGSRRMSLGRYGRVTLDQARTRAKAILGKVAAGEDPARSKREGVLLSELAERYLNEHARVKKKPSSVRMDESNLRGHVLPQLGHRRVDQLSRADVGSLHHSMRATPGAANRVLALLSKLFNLAERWGLRPDGSNPCRHIERFPEQPRERCLSIEELARFRVSLREAERTGIVAPQAAAALRLLLLTGRRLCEILTLRWEHLDLSTRLMRLPDTKTGAKSFPLNTQTIEVLGGLRSESP